MANTSTLFIRLNRITNARSIVETCNQSTASGGDTRGRLYPIYHWRSIPFIHKDMVQGVRGKDGRFVA
jgi:hypothetical protein